MSATGSKPVLNDDGTVRRKYEPDEPGESRHVLYSTIGLVFANAFVLLKNVLYGAPAPAYRPAEGAPQRAEKAGGTGEPASTEPSFDGSVPDASRRDEDAADEGSQFVKRLLGSSGAPDIVPVAQAPISFRMPVAANGNVPLYGAAPGRGISTTTDGSAWSFDARSFAAGGGGGGGGGDRSDHGASGGHQNDDDDDQPTRHTNRRPVVSGPSNLGSVFANQSLVIGLLDLLHNVSDPDGDALSVRELVASSGTLTVRPGGSWLFTPDLDDTTNVTFTYKVSDGPSETAQTATLDLVGPATGPILGTPFDDRIVGTIGDDTILALEGSDVVIGLGGNDIIYGGDGCDRIVTGDGNDVIYAGAGNDIVFAGGGNDVVYGGLGADVMFGEAGDDALFGDEGNDWIDGGIGRDLLDGGAGNDRLTGGSGRDTALGGIGNDTFYASEHDDNDIYDGGADRDTLDLSALRPITQSHTATLTDTATPAPPAPPAPASPPTGGTSDPAGDARSHPLPAGGATMVASSTESGEPVGEPAAGGTPPASGGPAGDGSPSDPLVTAAEVTGGTPRPGETDVPPPAGAGDPPVATLASADSPPNVPRDTSADCVIDLEKGTASGALIGDDILISIENVICGGGNDIIIANAEQNDLTGGAGDDVFVFHTSASVGYGHGNRDRILDFEVGDRIDLDDISHEFADAVDAEFADSSIQHFLVIDQMAEFSRPGQLRLRYDTFEGRETTIIDGNIDFDDEAEFALELVGHHDLHDHHFISGHHGHG